MPSTNIPSAESLDVAVLSFELTGLGVVAGQTAFAPKRVQLTPAGKFRSVDGRQIGEGKAGPITRQLQDLFFGLFTGSTPDKHRWLE